ncbi:MAG: PIN domain-containing protein [Bacteroidota bacterium]
MARYLLDTNVLVYSLDGSDAAKQARALDVIARVGAPGAALAAPLGVLPAQALAEFSRVALAKLKPPLSPDEAYAQVSLYEQVFPVLPLTAAVVREAIRGMRDHAFSYFDAQIWAAARLHQVPVVLSEDFAAGSTVEGVSFVDPFAIDFDAATL